MDSKPIELKTIARSFNIPQAATEFVDQAIEGNAIAVKMVDRFLAHSNMLLSAETLVTIARSDQQQRQYLIGLVQDGIVKLVSDRGEAV